MKMFDTFAQGFSLQWGKCRVILTKCREHAVLSQPKGPISQTFWMELSLLEGAGKAIILSRDVGLH